MQSKVARQREYFWQTVTNYLTETYDLIVLEDLQLKFMQQNWRLAHYVYDAALGRFGGCWKKKQRGAGAY